MSPDGERELMGGVGPVLAAIVVAAAVVYWILAIGKAVIG